MLNHVGVYKCNCFHFLFHSSKNVLKLPDMLSRSVTIANTLSFTKYEMDQAIDSSIDMKTILQQERRKKEIIEKEK